MWIWFGLFAQAAAPRDIPQRVHTEVTREFINNPALLDPVKARRRGRVLDAMFSCS